MVSASVFAPANCPYEHTTDALWTLWLVHDRVLSSAVLSGTYANKAGYHNKRNNLPNSDYSSGRDVQNDDEGPGDKSAGLDVSMSEAQMIQVTTRLWNAAQNNDPRLKWNGEYILREFIGTKNGTTVHCWVFVGGVPLGVGADQGSDPGRDSSHLWHVHYSVIRKFLNNMAALLQIASIAVGETVTEWKDRIMAFTSEDKADIRLQVALGIYDALRVAALHVDWNGLAYQSGGSGIVVGSSIEANLRTLATTPVLQALVPIASAVDIDQTELDAIKQAAQEGATAAQQVLADTIVTQVLAGLPEGTLTKADVEASLHEVLPQYVGPAFPTEPQD